MIHFLCRKSNYYNIFFHTGFSVFNMKIRCNVNIDFCYERAAGSIERKRERLGVGQFRMSREDCLGDCAEKDRCLYIFRSMIFFNREGSF